MSDSDDTDVLLLIPPDFFLVNTSDSEDSISPEVQERCSEYEKLVVNGLISQVNELKNRISVIENENSIHLPRNVWETSCLHQFFDCAAYLGFSAYQQLGQNDLTLQPESMSAQHRFGGSCDNLRKHQGVSCSTNSLHSTPVKQKQAFSLPSTPSINTNVSDFPSNSRLGRRSLSPEKSAIIIEPMTPKEILSMSHAVADNTNPSGSTTSTDVMHYPSISSKKNHLHQDSTLIGEIDQFLDSMKKNSKGQSQMDTVECNKKANTCNCGEYSSSIPDVGLGLRDFNKLPVREEVVKSKNIAPLEKEKTASVNETDLHEFGQLFQEGQSDLNGSEHPMPKAIINQPCQQKKGYHCGDTVTSVPDLAFGLRSFDSLPVREEEVKQKTVLPLGINEMKGLELSDVEKLLRQMEATQHEIEKLQHRESLIKTSSIFSEKDHVPTTQNTPFTADTVGSVPDRGFGDWGVLSSSKPVPVCSETSCNGASVPVHEERVRKKNISLLGTQVASDKTQRLQVRSGIEQHPDRQNIHMSDAGTNEETERPLQVASNYLGGQEDLPKVSVTRRKLELGDNAATIPDCGFGLKRWYNSENNKNGSSESVLHCSNNVPHSVRDGVIPSHSRDGRSAVSFTSKNVYVQGDYLPSVPDLGCGLRKLWTNNVLSQGLEQNTLSCNPKSQTSAETQIHHMQTNSDLNAVGYSVLSQPRVTAGKADHVRVGDQRSNVSTEGQSHSMAEGDRGSAVTDTVTDAKKKMDLSGGSAQEGVGIMQQEEGSEGVRNKPGYGSAFHESGISSMMAPVSSGTSNLVSLSDLWDKDGSSSASQIRNEHTNMRLRLEEEKYRRQHCERLIQQLQIHLLEEQQKLAVAVQVDRRKDQAILQLQDAWSRLVHHWKVLEEQRHNLSNRLLSEREAHQTQEFETKQKLKQLESELSKALDLAQGYKEKLDSVEKEKLGLIDRHNSNIDGLMGKIQDNEEELDNINQLNCQLIQQKEDALEKVKEAEQEAQKERKLLIDAQREVEDTHKKLYSLEAELSALKEERESLQLKLKEEKGRISLLDQQKRSLQATLDENKKKEKSIREEMKQLTAQSEKIKVELREYYQEQLEVVVRDKLREFQEQLDAAETSLHKELEQQEHALNEVASQQVKQISEKHQLEMQLLEEKHTEELHLYKLQLAQAVQQISQLEAKLQGYDSRKSAMVEKLHSLMETQWQEALRIVSGSSPLATHGAEHTRLQVHQRKSAELMTGRLQSQKKENPKTNTSTWPVLTQNHPAALDRNGPFLTSHSSDEHTFGKNYIVSGTNIETLPESSKMAADTPYAFKDYGSMSQPQMPPVCLHQQNTGSSTADEMPFSRDGLLTYRKAEQSVPLQATSLSTGSLKINQEDELKKYIMMLLDRSPGNPVDEENQPPDLMRENHDEKLRQDARIQDDKQHQLVDIPTNEGSQRPKWEKILHGTHLNLAGSQHQSILSFPTYDLPKSGHGSARDLRHVKPPWK